ncbi:hypothetical protein U4E84_09300 [Halorubrum sp. AD140]|uniref:hypothetical protein n=1 Tax=Halorubrum sp. AD140 TaxID=3050073 RepID=UPI002ACC676B|nr:hypothetical protein [Halorubrum sp. AD140]MDZ5811539.1 hypothetical protein [Halorubrum sp. AD140]
MTTEEIEWKQSQKIRLGREQRLLAVVGIALAFFDGVSNWPVVALCALLLIIAHIRHNAVNSKRRELAEQRLSVTNPILISGSLSVIFYLVTRAVDRIDYSATLIGDVVMFSVLCLLLGLGILLVEHYSNSEYFDWWSERALNRSRRKQDEFWIWVAGAFRKFSPTEMTEADIKKMKRKRRVKQRLNDGPFTPTTGPENPPSFKWSYCSTMLREMMQWKRSLPIIVGILFLQLQGIPVWIAFLGSTVVWMGASVLADHVKYWYYFRPVRDGVFQEPRSDTMTQRFINQLQSYWASDLLAICVLWIAF